MAVNLTQPPQPKVPVCGRAHPLATVRPWACGDECLRVQVHRPVFAVVAAGFGRIGMLQLLQLMEHIWQAAAATYGRLKIRSRLERFTYSQT